MGTGDIAAVSAALEYEINSLITSKWHLIAQIISGLCGLFIAFTFLQSGLNKLFDYKGNRSYFGSVFEKTFLKTTTGLLLPIILLMELASALTIFWGIISDWTSMTSMSLTFGLALSALTIVFLLLGQRIAKDYAGAASLTGYFIVAVLGLFACAMKI